MAIDITHAEYIRSITGEDSILADPRKQIAFVGRSNVGKSSVINTLADRNDMAQSSSTPGKTQSVDFYLINDSFYFVDLPGFGYTSGSAKDAETLRQMIIWYLAQQPHPPQLVLHVIDGNAGITRKDEDMLDILVGEEYATLILINKIDKLNQSESAAAISSVKDTLSERAFKSVDIVPFSTQTKQGRKEVLRIFSDRLSS